MKKKLGKIVKIGFILFLLMQLYQPTRNIDTDHMPPTHIVRTYPVPADINEILTVSCYDCHSNNTNYPWYAYIQPGRLFMESHIRKGKKELNFSEFGNLSARKQESKFEEIIKQVKKGEMPLASYTLLHPDAKISDEKKKRLLDWVKSISHDLEEVD
jgi:hypothetical protein